MLNTESAGRPFIREEYEPPPLEATNSSTTPYETVELVLAAPQAPRVCDHFDESCIEFLDDGHVHVLVTLPIDTWLREFLVSLGDDAVIVRPASLREAVMALRNAR